MAFVKASFGNAPDVLVDFGLSPRKATTPLTAEQKAVASAKRKATRAARHVMGSKQRKAVTAPVQVAYMIGHGCTSGLSAIDAFLADDMLAPPGAEAVFSEQLSTCAISRLERPSCTCSSTAAR